MSNFKGGNGHWKTKSLFHEKSDSADDVVFTLKDHDIEVNGVKLPSLKRLYLETADATEYEFATEYLGGWQHWQQLVKFALRDEIEEWREELEVKLRSEGFKMLRQLSDEGDRTAARYLADVSWKEKRKAGAPSKAEKAGAIKEHVSKVASLDAHIRRITS